MICSRPEFIVIAGCTNANLTTYRSRGRVVTFVGDDGKEYIDTNHPINADFLKKRKEIIASKNESQKPAPKKTISKKTQTPVNSTVQTTAQDTGTEKTDTRYSLEIRKLQAEIQQKEAKIILDELKIKTLSGNNIPKTVVTEMFATLGKSLLVGYKEFIDQFVSDICHENKIPDAVRAKMIGEMVKGLNASHKNSVETAKAHFKMSLKKSKIDESLTDEDETDD